MQTDHVIAQCTWQTTFDHEGKAVGLQDFISRWSNTVLLDELDRCFNDWCPAPQTWRFADLQLDLGEISLEDLAIELPKRVRAGLHETLRRMIAERRFTMSHDHGPCDDQDNRRDHGGNPGADLQVFGQLAATRAFLPWFLQHGSLPWWCKGGENALDIVDRLFEKPDRASLDILRDAGRSELVRKRLVWQLGEGRVRTIIHLLEPWHGDFICAWADHLFVVQAQRQFPLATPTEFRESVWLTVLRHLMVERGSMFNTIAFARASLWQTAQHYQLNYQQLLSHLFQAARALEPRGRVTHQFFSAIKTLYRQDVACPKVAPPAPAAPPDYWARLQTMLRHGAQRGGIADQQVRIAELFTALAEEDGARMASLLRLEGRSPSVRQGILRHFAPKDLALLVRVLAPQDHLFIVAHAEHTQALADARRWDKKSVWQVLLAYLLLAQGSYFHRRQLVRDTLREICKRHGFDFSRMLDLLIHSVVVKHPNHHRFELLGIFQDLKDEVARQQTLNGVKPRYASDWPAILHYLKTGATPDSARLAALAAGLFSGTGAASLDTAATPAQALALLLREPALHSLTDATLCQRLLGMVGAADLPRVFQLIAPEALDVCQSLIQNLPHWRRQALLPSLDRVDLALQWPALMIQALPGLYARHSDSQPAFHFPTFWLRFETLLKQQAKVDIHAFRSQLKACQPHATIMAAIIADRPPDPIAAADAAPTGDAAPWSTNALFQALRQRGMTQGSRGGRALPPALRRMASEQLWRQLEGLGGDAISQWLARQPDQYTLLRLLTRERPIAALTRHLLSQLPAELNPPQEVLKQWSSLLRQGGLWLGTTAVLDQHLHDVFWTVGFDAQSHACGADELLAHMIASACLRLSISLADCLTSLQSQRHALEKTPWLGAYNWLLRQARRDGPADQPVSQPASAQLTRAERAAAPRREAFFQQDHLCRYLDHPRLLDIASHLLRHGRPPGWIKHTQAIDLTRLLFDLCTRRPHALPVLLGGLQHQPLVKFRLLTLMPFSWLEQAMRKSAPGHDAVIKLLAAFHQWLGRIVLPDVSTAQSRAILFQLVLRHWLAHDMNALQPDKLLREFIWQLMREHLIGKEKLARAFAPEVARLPQALQLTLTQFMADVSIKVPAAIPAAPPSGRAAIFPKPENKTMNIAQAAPPLTTPMRINNAGIVLLQGFFMPLFERLGLIANKQFINDGAQRRAVHYLQFLVSGCSETQEQYLMVNKLLCGLALHEPVEVRLEMTAMEVEICQSLLRSVIEYWSAIGRSSIDGFRGNWLVRDGSLAQTTDHWDLIVDRRAYDVLLARAPFSYSVIKLPWMEKAIYVTWPA